MSSKLSARHVQALSKATALVLIGASVVACSNDASRFSDALTTSTSMTANQHSIMHKGTSKQVFPGNTVSNAVAPVAQAASTGIRITKPNVTSSPLANAVSNVKRSAVSGVKRIMPSAPPVVSQTSVAKPAIAAATQTLSQKAGAPMVLPPRRTGPVALKMAGTDVASTGSVVSDIVTSGERKGGWGQAGGTYVVARSGETLYNLSRRYGVPVGAILKANSMTDANALSAGSKILIPAYTYSNSTGVSAPDNHPVTKAVRSSTGFQGQAKGRVATPKNRAAQKAPSAKPVTSKQVASSRPLAAAGQHTVVSGDTLYGIANTYGVRSADILAANNMSSSTIRLGQKLRIPGASDTVASKRLKADPVQTGSIPASTRSKEVKSASAVKPAYTAPNIKQRSAEKVSTPAKTSAGSFRWPTRGRVITKFGERQNGSVNDGIDISVPEGTPIKAAETGTVIYSGSELADFGNLILVSHSGGWVSAYAHASKNNVKRGDKVGRGQVIAMSGRSGNANVPKLHFELRKDSTPVNPLKHLAK